MQGECTPTICSWGAYLPEGRLTNRDLEQMVETSDEWIVTRTGIKERRLAGDAEAASDMGYYAAKEALENVRCSPEEIDLVLVATFTPDYLTPATATLIQARLGAVNAAAFDLQAACTGFLTALSIANGYIRAGIYRTVLIVATEKVSAYVDYTDRNTCVLFGDGAAACLIRDHGPGMVVNRITLGCDGEQASLIAIPAGGSREPPTRESVEANRHKLQMAGKEVFKHAVRRMASAISALFDEEKLCEEQIAYFVPHQANERIIDAIGKNFSFSPEKVYKTVDRYGNTSASSIPLAIYDLLKEHALQDGERLLLSAFGAGLAWGAGLLTYRTASSG